MTMSKTFLPRMRRSACLALAALGFFALPAAAHADYYSSYSHVKSYYSSSYSGGSYGGKSYSGRGNSYSGGSYGGRHHHSGGHGGGYHGHKPSRPVTQASSGRRYHYSTGYRSGGSGYSWLGFRRGEDSSTGYTGANTFVNRPHRSNWQAKLNEQRRWDERQYKAMQVSGKGAECGFTTSPAYCYKLEGPYPEQLKVVRY